MNSFFPKLPSVNELLDTPPLKTLVDQANRNAVVQSARQFLEKLASDVQSAAASRGIPTPAELAQQLAQWIRAEDKRRPQRVINATGIILNRQLGGLPLAVPAIQAAATAVEVYSSFGIDLETGHATPAYSSAERLLTQLLGAESAAVVNSHTSALLLALAALPGEEVVVARGDVSEIEAGLGLPAIVAAAGKRLKEVGTANVTRLADYEEAIGSQTAAILRVRTGHFQVVGATERASLADLAALGRRRNVTVIDDVSSGALIDMTKYGLGGEAPVGDSLQQGADLVIFSGGKLLGGPDCGILAGKVGSVRRVVGHPLARAYEAGTLTLAALAGTLELYRDAETVERNIPLLSLLASPVENLKNRAERLAPQIAASKAVVAAEPLAGTVYLAGDPVPSQSLATWCVALSPAHGNAESLAAALRRSEPAVLARVQDQRVFIDLRSVFPSQDCEIATALETIGGPRPAEPVAAQ